MRVLTLAWFRHLLVVGVASSCSSGVTDSRPLGPRAVSGVGSKSVAEAKAVPSHGEQYALFEQLSAQIGNATVVALGEATHYGSATFDAKVDAVKYTPKRLLLKQLEGVLREPVPPRAARAVEHLFSLELVRSEDERREDRSALLALLGRVRQLEGTGSMWSRVAAGLLFLDEDHWDYQFRKRVTIEMANLRDQHMGRNVLWWSSQYPSEKLVVWGANIHVARTHDGLDVPDDAASRGWSRRNSVPAGQWVADQLGGSYFAVAFSAAAGQVGDNVSWTQDVGPARSGFLEHAALRTGPRLLSRETLAELGQPTSLLLGGGSATAPWARLFDAVVVLPSETPAKRRPDCENRQ